MDDNQQLLQDIISDLREWKPALRQPEAMSDRIINRIQKQRYLQRTSLLLRIIGTAAVLMLLMGVAGAPKLLSGEPEVERYQRQLFSQRVEKHYLQTKFFEKTIYDELKQYDNENNH